MNAKESQLYAKINLFAGDADNCFIFKDTTMKKHIICAILSFLFFALTAGFTGSIILIEFAISTYPGSIARIGLVTPMIFIISFLCAVTIPIICMIHGLKKQIENRLKKTDVSD